jgi:hypothetical protein
MASQPVLSPWAPEPIRQNWWREILGALRDNMRHLQADHPDKKSITREDFRSFVRLGFLIHQRTQLPNLSAE